MFHAPLLRHHTCLLPLLAAVSLMAAHGVSQAAAPAGPDPKADLKRLTAEIASRDPDRIKAAVTEIRAFVASNKQTSWYVIDGVNLLLKAKAYDGIDEIVQDTLANGNDLGTTVPSATTRVATLLKARMIALLASGKKEEGLAAAKTYYNYAALDQTLDSISTVSLALLTARPEDKGIIARFKKQQLAGADTQPAASTAPATSAAANASVLDSIQVDGKAFQEAADQVDLDDYRAYVRKGNLLLLAGNGKDAHDVFDKAKVLADGKQLSEAIANVARAIRTENGCVGPANAYILKMRENPAQ